MSNFAKFAYIDDLSTRSKLRRLIWNLVWAVLGRPTPRGVLNSWRIFLLRAFGARIGVGSRVAPSCRVWAPWNLVMGDYSVLGDDVDCYSMAKITLGSKVAISQRTYLCAGTHDTRSLRRPLVTKPITIRDHAWVAAECFIGPGVEVGSGTVIGARSVVTKNMPAWVICAGVPCRPMKARDLDEESVSSLNGFVQE